jgi:hypothetical protein
MKRNSHLDPGLLRRRALSFLSACVLASPAALLAQQYQQTNLVSDLGTLGAQTVDPKLKNPWGIARGPSGNPWWVSDERSGVATLYNAHGTPANPLNPGANGLVVTIPPSVPPPAVGTPTGVVFNGSANDFRVAPPGVAQTFFLFVSLDGSISGWDPAANPTTAITKVSTKSVFTGATIAQIGNERFLYVADLKDAKIKVYDSNFKEVEIGERHLGERRTWSAHIVAVVLSPDASCSDTVPSTNPCTHPSSRCTAPWQQPVGHPSGKRFDRRPRSGLPRSGHGPFAGALRVGCPST